MGLIKFYPASKNVLDWIIKPVPASKHIAQWYKDMPSTHAQFAATIKRCMAIFDIMSAGYILYTPCDIYIDATNPDRLELQIPYLANMQMEEIGREKEMSIPHTYEQYSKYPIDTSIYHKEIWRINPLWYIQTEKGYSTLFIPPAHSDNVPFKALEAIIDTDEYISQGYLSLMVKKGFKGIIKQGTPLVQVIPYKREAFKMEIGDHNEYKSLMTKQFAKFVPKFMGAYKDLFRSKKEYR